MISYRQADLSDRIQRQLNNQSYADAAKRLRDEARAAHEEIFEYEFSGITIDGRTYSGKIHVVYDATYRRGESDTNIPPHYEIAITNKVILPGDAAEEFPGNTPDREIYDARELDRLRELLEAAISDEHIEGAIENSLMERYDKSSISYRHADLKDLVMRKLGEYRFIAMAEPHLLRLIFGVNWVEDDEIAMLKLLHEEMHEWFTKISNNMYLLRSNDPKELETTRWLEQIRDAIRSRFGLAVDIVGPNKRTIDITFDYRDLDQLP